MPPITISIKPNVVVLPPIPDLVDSIAWSAKGGTVRAYFTVHFAQSPDDPNVDQPDAIHYAMGELTAISGALVGELTDVFANSDTRRWVPDQDPGPDDFGIHEEGTDEGMVLRPELSYVLRVAPQGSVSVQLKEGGTSLHKRAFGGTAVAGGLLQGASKIEGYTLSLDRRPAPPGPPK